MNTSRQLLMGGGTQTSALAVGGEITADSALNESWDGTAWTELGDLNTARRDGAAAITNNSTGIVFGGTEPKEAKTEDWNGSTWTEVADLSAAVASHGGNGNSRLALKAAGDVSGRVTTTEEWTVPFATKTIGTD